MTGTADSVDRSAGGERLDVALREAKAGSRSAAQALVKDLTPIAWHVARAQGLSPQDTEDVLQTAWLELFRHADRLKDPRSLAAWLIVTTRREAARRHARPIPLSEEIAETLASALPGPEEEALRADRDRRVWNAFRRLPDRCQELLRLTVLAGRADYQLIAEVMHLPRGSIGPTRGRCLAMLRELLAEDDEQGNPEELPGRLDGLLDKADPAPDDLSSRMAVAVTAHGRALDQHCFVYVSGDDHAAAERLAAAITEMLAQHGVEAVPDGPPVISSWAQRFTLRAKRGLSRSEVKQRLQKVEHAIEVVALQKPMSEVNAQHADAANKLLSAAGACDDFIALVGSLLLVKHTDETGRVTAYTQTLSVAQVRALEQNQHLLKSPAELLAHLETLSCAGENREIPTADRASAAD